MYQPLESASPEVHPKPQELTTTAPQPPAQVAALQIKLPPFWPQDPQLWFAQIEAQFTTCHITISRTKFDCHHFARIFRRS